MNLANNQIKKVSTYLEVTRVCERDALEGKHGRGEAVAGGEAQRDGVLVLDLLDESVVGHLVQDLLPALGLSHKVGVGTAAGNEVLDVLDLLLNNVRHRAPST